MAVYLPPAASSYPIPSSTSSPNSSSIQLKTLQFHDVEPLWPQIVKLMDAVYMEYPNLYDGAGDGYDYNLDVFRKARDTHFCLIFDGPKIVGFIGSMCMEDAVTSYMKHLTAKNIPLQSKYYIGETVILPEYRGKGLGKKLHEAAETHARHLDYSEFWLCTLDESRVTTPAPAKYSSGEKFWRNRGFTRHPELIFNTRYKAVGESAETAHGMIFYSKRLMPVPGIVVTTDDLRNIDTDATPGEKPLHLLDIDQNLIDSEYALGSGLFGSRLQKAIDELNLQSPLKTPHFYARVTLWINLRVPACPVQLSHLALLGKFKRNDIPVMGLTLRGKQSWYDLKIQHGAEIAERQLGTACVRLEDMQNPFNAEKLPPDLSPKYNIFFTEQRPKGEFIVRVFQNSHYRPPSMTFSDDRFEYVKAVVASALKLKIPCIGYHNTKVKDGAPGYDLMIAIIQFIHLFQGKKIPSNNEAQTLKVNYEGTDPMDMLKQLLVEIDKAPEKLNQQIAIYLP